MVETGEHIMVLPAPNLVQLIYGYKGVNLKEIAKEFFLPPCISVMSLEHQKNSQ